MVQAIIDFLSADIRNATTLLLAALGLVFIERAGIVNIATEGIMLIGAVLGCIGAERFGSSFMGAVFAVVGGMLCGLIFAFFTVTLRSNQIVIGTAFNILAGGLTVTLNRALLSGQPVPRFPEISIPGLSQIPVIGDFFSSRMPVYIAFLLVPLCWFVLYRTNIGLKVRAVGENPKACDTVGINVFKVRYSVLLFGCALAGLAGAYVSIGLNGLFTEGMVSGKGFMAIAVCVFGNYSPGTVMGAALLFGAAEKLMINLQSVPGFSGFGQIVQMLPYVITIVALCVFAKRSNKPASSGVAYRKE